MEGRGGGGSGGEGARASPRVPGTPPPDAAGWDSESPSCVEGARRLPECFGGQGDGAEKVQCKEGAAFPACALEREESAREGLTPETRSLTSWLVCL